MDYLAVTLLMLTGIFLILLVLVQRGRGGGLAGAFGGMGGQSAFGTKAGDVFTKITVVVALVWVLLAGGSILALRSNNADNFKGGNDPKLTVGEDDPDGEKLPPAKSDDPAGTDPFKAFEADPKPTDGDAKPDTPAEEKPATDAKPDADAPAAGDAEKPAAPEKPKEEEPAEADSDKPAEDKPATDKPEADKPAEEKPPADEKPE